MAHKSTPEMFHSCSQPTYFKLLKKFERTITDKDTEDFDSSRYRHLQGIMGGKGQGLYTERLISLQFAKKKLS